jgi:hypothetical protein
MKNPESNLQISCVKWFRLQYPDRIIAAIPNGGKRGIVTASIMKAEGVLPGMPDLIIPEPMGLFHGMFIEMKSETGTTSQHQKEILRRLNNVGYAVYVCRSLDNFMQVVNDYFKKNLP